MLKGCTISTRFFCLNHRERFVALDFLIFLSIINSSSDNCNAILFSYHLFNFVSKYLKWTWGGVGRKFGHSCLPFRGWWTYIHLVPKIEETTFKVGMASLYIFNDHCGIRNNGKFYMSHALGGMYWHPCIFSAPGQWVTLEVIHSYADGCNT